MTLPTWGLIVGIVLLGTLVCIPQLPTGAVGIAACLILFLAGVLVGRWLP